MKKISVLKLIFFDKCCVRIFFLVYLFLLWPGFGSSVEQKWVHRTDEGETDLHIGALYGNIGRILKFLKEHPELINDPNYHGNTALHIFCVGLNLTENPDRPILILVELLKRGANPHISNDYNRTALHLCAMKGNVEAVRELIKRGVNVDQKDEFGDTALMLATSYSRGGLMTRVLLDEGKADITLANERGLTALHLSASSEDEESVRILLKRGAKRNVRNEDGHFPWDVTDNPQIKALFLTDLEDL